MAERGSAARENIADLFAGEAGTVIADIYSPMLLIQLTGDLNLYMVLDTVLERIFAKWLENQLWDAQIHHFQRNIDANRGLRIAFGHNRDIMLKKVDLFIKEYAVRAFAADIAQHL